MQVRLCAIAWIAMGCFTAALASTFANGQATWIQRSPSTIPVARDAHRMVYEPVSGKTILFGGFNRAQRLQFSDTWEWDGGLHWLQVSTSSSPERRETFGMASDGAGGIVLFGGFRISDGSVLSDTWLFIQGDWIQMSPTNSPQARRSFAMARTGQNIILFGGQDGTNRFGDTWEWKGTDWTELNPPNNPSARQGARLAYDPDRDRLVLFGGSAQPGQFLGDTWEWDGNNWSELNPTNSPPDRNSHSMVYDTARRKIVLFGGLGDGLDRLDDTWEWDGHNWVERLPGVSPSARNAAAMVYDGARERSVLFGGRDSNNVSSDEIWEYSAIDPLVSSFGAGCLGSNGVPELAPLTGQAWIGQPFRLRLTHLPLSILNVPIGVIGFSKTQWAGFALPQDMAVFGMPGCTQYVAADLGFIVSKNMSTAIWSIDIPNEISLEGSPFYLQTFILDSGVNPAGATVTNAVESVIGIR